MRFRLGRHGCVGALAMLAGILQGMSGTQARAQWSVYGEASGGKFDYANSAHVQGFTLGAMRMWTRGPVAVGGDVRTAILWRGTRGTALTNEQIDNGTLGVRVAAAHLPFGLTPYAEGLLGDGYFSAGAGTTRQDKHTGVLEAVGGVDLRVTSKFSWRVAEFAYNRQVGNTATVHPQVISTGIVWHP